MTRYVAFLRAVNVGGRTVKKEQLIEAFSSIGLKEVVTLKQSGNVIFESTDNEEALTKRIEKELMDRFGFDVPTFVRTMDELEKIKGRSPYKENREGTSYLVTFFSSMPDRTNIELPVAIPASTAVVYSLEGREAYSETHGGGEGGLINPFLERSFRMKATTRNINIIRELLERYWSM